MNSDNHNYDGIEELDNPLPAWWLISFLGTIIFAFIYMIHYMTGSGPSLADEFQAQMQALPQATEKLWTEEELSEPFGAPENIAEGKALYAAKCAVCHGEQGQGIIGPNLTDHFWLVGTGQRKDILHTVEKGIVTNGMPAWGDVLSEKELINVSAYVYSLLGSNPANPKAPQGNEVPH